MTTILCWLWHDRINGGGRQFRPEYVNVLRRMFARNLEEHRFVCIADDGAGFDREVEYVRTPPAALAMSKHRNPCGIRFPSCYRRLWIFSDEAVGLFGTDPVLVVDIDIVLTGRIEPIVNRPEDFVGWRPLATWGRQADRIGGGIYMIRPGTHTEVWDDFKGAASMREALALDYRGSDQAWMSYKLGRNRCATWGKDAGIYSIRDMQNGALPLPADARLVQCNGPEPMKPWRLGLPWVRAAWR